MRKYTSPITLLLFVVIVALLQTSTVLSFSSPASISLQSKHIICPSSSSTSFHAQQQQCISININKRTNSSSSRLYMSDVSGEAAAAVPEKKGILQKVCHTYISNCYFLFLLHYSSMIYHSLTHLVANFCSIHSSSLKSHQHPNVKS